MNYIASFIYQLSMDEQETFYLMLGLFENTDFSLIFVDDLSKLKVFFHIFERLISLYLPELSSFFRSNSVIVNFFCSPWFITLFTNTFQFVSNTQQDQPRLILKIWDEFIMVIILYINIQKGWKAIFKVGIVLLNNYQDTLIQLKYEDLLHFLINDLIKSGFFQNSNYEYFTDMMDKIDLKTELINNLENEYNQDKKIKDI